MLIFTILTTILGMAMVDKNGSDETKNIILRNMKVIFKNTVYLYLKQKGNDAFEGMAKQAEDRVESIFQEPGKLLTTDIKIFRAILTFLPKELEKSKITNEIYDDFVKNSRIEGPQTFEDSLNKLISILSTTMELLKKYEDGESHN